MNRARELLYLGDDSKHTWSPVDIDGDLTDFPKFKEAIPIKFTLVPGKNSMNGSS